MRRIQSATLKTVWEVSLRNKTEIVFSTLFTFILTLGYLLSTYDNIDVGGMGKQSILLYFCGSIVIWSIIFFCLTSIKQVCLRKPAVSKKIFQENISDKKLWLLTSCAIFICYLPIILMGLTVLTPDSWSSIRQITGDLPLSNAHPIIFTAFAGIFIRFGLLFGSLEFGLVLFSLAQSAILAMIFAQVIVWLRRQGIGKVGLVTTFLFYAIFPINAIAGIILWKDILFAGFGLLFLLVLRQLYIEGDKFFTRKKIFYFISLAFLFCAWRNNGFYAYVLFSIIYTMLNYRIFFKPKYLLIIFLPILLFLLYSSLSSLFSTPSSQGEAMSVPLQQIARTVKYHSNSISEEDKTIINEILPFDQLGNKYNPSLSDPIKSSFNVNIFKENKVKYAKLWVSLLVDHKKTYLAAFLYNSFGYTYPFYPSTTTTDIVLDNASHFNALNSYTDDAYDNGNKQAIAEYRNLTESTVPLLRNIGFYFCIMLFGLYIAIIKRRKELLGVFVILFCIFLTTIFGPVNGEFRYLYLFVVSAPFIMGSIFSGNTIIKNKGSHA